MEGAWVKLMSDSRMVNRGHRFARGRNTVDFFDATDECGPGIYFCRPRDAIIWANALGYTHICDVEIPPAATVVHFEHKSKADQLDIVSDPLPFRDHDMWRDREVCLETVKIDADALLLVKEQTPEVCLAAVKQSGHALQHVRAQTPEVCLAAVRQNGSALQHVREQTPEICLAAMNLSGLAFQFVREQTPEVSLAAVRLGGHMLRNVVKQTPEICLAAVQQYGSALRYVREQTPEVCMAAVRQDEHAIEFVRDDSMLVSARRAGKT